MVARLAIFGLLAATALAFALAPPVATAKGKSKQLSRPADPVVLDGARVDRLLGARPDRVVAFATKGRKARRWQQVPVQVDERDAVDLGQVYNGTFKGIVVDAYSDPSTFTGSDSDPRLDPDDEIALMAAEARPKRASAKAGAPRGVKRSTRVEIKVSDPLERRARGYLYLFEARSGKLDPAAGADLVDYDFELRSGDYKSTYELEDGPNPERTRLRTDFYELGFSDRWINDLLEIRARGADRSDIFDRRKVQFAPGFCGRSTDTFTDAEGAFVTNIDGPVRAIRSFVGANSGPLTQRTHIFYERREDVSTDLRVHPIPSVIDFTDYSPAAAGMLRRAEGYPDATIDGVPEDRSGPAYRWEQVSGTQGTLTQVPRVETDFDVGLSAYYLDQKDPATKAEVQCTGDDAAYGASGIMVDGPIPNTDPTLGEANRLQSTRTLFYDRPDLDRAAAELRSSWVDRPLRTRVSDRSG